MSDQRDGGIAWTDQTWNPVRGCSLVSPGCTNCYAMGMAARFSGPGQPYEGLAKRVNGRGVWTGEVRLVRERLADPLRWKRPRRVFVNSMSDLFHESLTNEQIAAVFGAMAAAPQHTFQVLTKRPERAVEWFRWLADYGGWLMLTQQLRLALWESGCSQQQADRLDYWAQNLSVDTMPWPLPNVWIGASAEDQQRLDERVPHLLQIPAAVRFLSLEPLLGPIFLESVPLPFGSSFWDPLRPPPTDSGGAWAKLGKIDWVIVGGESGPRSRPCDVAWIRSIVRQCRAAGVACFVKQLGRFPIVECGPPAQEWAPNGRDGVGFADDEGFVHLRDPKGGDPAEWPADLRVQQWPSESRP